MNTRLGIIAKPPNITSPAITHWRLITPIQHRAICIMQHTTQRKQQERATGALLLAAKAICEAPDQQ